MRVALISTGIATTRRSIVGGGDIFNIYLLRALKDLGHEAVLSVKTPTRWGAIEHDLGWVCKPDRELKRSSLKILEKTKLITQFIPSPQIEMLKRVCDITFNTYGDNLFWNTDLSYMHTPYTREEMRAKYGKNNISRIYYSLYSSLAERRKSKLATMILTNSSYSKRIIEETIRFTARILYPPIDTDLYKSALSKVPKRLDNVVTIARFTWEKNLQLIPELAARVKNATFHIMGSLISPESFEVVRFLKRKSLELSVVDRVVIHPNPLVKDRLRILSGSKVYVNTLKEEHFGMAVAEALSAGLAPVVPNGGGQVEIVPDKGHLYEDFDEAASKIEGWLSRWSPSEAERLSRRAEKFSYQEFKANLNETLDRVISAKRR